MSSASLVLIALQFLAIPLIIRNPLVGLMIVVGINPFENLFPLPAGLSLGRVAGVITVTSWLLFLSSDPFAVERLKRSKILSYIWLFPVACILSATLASFETPTVANIAKTSSVVLLSIVAAMIENLLWNEKQLRLLLWSIAISSAVLSIFPIAYFLGFDLYSLVGYQLEDTASGSRGRVSGLNSNANGLASNCLLGLCAIFALVSKRAVTGIPIAAMTIAAGLIFTLILTGSRTNFIAAILCIACLTTLYSINLKRNNFLLIFVGCASLFLIPLLLSFAPEAIQERLSINSDPDSTGVTTRIEFQMEQQVKSIENVMQKPIFGAGLANYSLTSSDGFGAHDTISALLTETGLLGFFSFMLTSILTLKMSVFTLRHSLYSGNNSVYFYTAAILAGFIAVLVSGVGGTIVFYQRWFWFAIGLTPVLLTWTNSEDTRSDEIRF